MFVLILLLILGFPQISCYLWLSVSHWREHKKAHLTSVLLFMAFTVGSEAWVLHWVLFHWVTADLSIFIFDFFFLIKNLQNWVIIALQSHVDFCHTTTYEPVIPVCISLPS